MTHEASSGWLRATGEGDRTAEFKESRARIVSKVNDWLADLSIKRDDEETLSDGRLILANPRLVTTDLGPSGTYTRAQVEERSAGVSLTGDGQEKPFKFQSVKAGADRKTLEIIEAQGSDPLAISVYGDTFTTNRQLEVLAEFGTRTLSQESREQYFRFSFTGDGQVSQQFITDEGVHTRRTVNNIAGLEMASAALDQVISSVA